MRDHTLQDIKDRLDIAEVIGGYIQLRKSGTNFKALCPFHGEKTPSLMVSPAKQIWHCFGCGEGGDIFGFVMRHENLEFKEALKLLAQKAGVTLPAYSSQDRVRQELSDTLKKINDFAARFYHQVLFSNGGKEALEYLNNRGFTLETIKRWKIGFAPEDFHFLEKTLLAKKVKREDLVKAGVSVKNEKGQVYDRFRGRITFPIFDFHGEVAGFTARILKGDQAQAKYVNSPVTPFYNKSKIIFGLNFAKAAIRKEEAVIIVEGQTDCISAHQAGIGNVVASSGTAFTEEQLNILGRFTKNLVFAFDSDEAGLMATKRAMENYLAFDFNIKIIDLLASKDPDELIKQDPEIFKNQIKKATPFLDYYIERLFNQLKGESIEQKKQIAKEVLPFVKAIPNSIEQDHYINILAGKFGTSPKVLWETLEKAKAIRGNIQSKSISKNLTYTVKTTLTLEKEILGGMLKFKEFKSGVLENSNPEEFESYEIRELVRPLFEKDSEQNIARIINDSTLAKEAVFMVESLQAESGDTSEVVIRSLEKSFAIFKLKAIKKKQAGLAIEIKRAEAAKNQTKLNELNEEFVRTSRERVTYESTV